MLVNIRSMLEKPYIYLTDQENVKIRRIFVKYLSILVIFKYQTILVPLSLLMIVLMGVEAMYLRTLSNGRALSLDRKNANRCDNITHCGVPSVVMAVQPSNDTSWLMLRLGPVCRESPPSTQSNRVRPASDRARPLDTHQSYMASMPMMITSYDIQPHPCDNPSSPSNRGCSLLSQSSQFF